MVRGYVQEHIFRHPWERVTAASWRKYADVEHRQLLSHVVDVSIVNRIVDQEAGQLLTTRAITVNASGPWWLQRLTGTSVCHCLEESIVDNAKRSLEMVTRNVTLKDFVDVEEKCSYFPHPENSEWTLLRQETNITCASMPALKSMTEKIEQKCAEKFQQNSVRGREVVEYVCKALERAESAAAAAAQTTIADLQLVVSAPSKAVAAATATAATQTNSMQSSSSSRSHSNINMMRRILDRAEFVGATF